MIMYVMNFSESIKTCLTKKYLSFSGRASRSEFWFFVLFGLLGGVISAIIDTMILGYSAEVNGPINLIFSVALILPSIAVTTRRLHDINKSGWWQLLWLTVIGGIVVIVWNATEGEKKKNKHGQPIKIKK